MKLYPAVDPLAVNMLIDYTIFPDLKFYHVPFNCFYEWRDGILNGTNFEKVELNKIKINTLLTLTLEAERIL